ncbi:succinate dehydrogenase assembly factor 2 [Polymorphum gilvum]|uniref:FAD assembly factor SdhE n=1 Tax=Polymorphum gilvum (strain LMG 25793 / CGMCC 1.9160 / SL003B-26A1) TaxID=991905 RepID=F2J0R3_POLGS|nr:succinate dehydrogenase assembly factor 2 [Polymorphum gilvum]ADZ70749.1 TPR repeat region superfamily protein [Polymorphum gilvum SL003B-26A1]
MKAEEGQGTHDPLAADAVRRKRILFRCWHRGMKEMDLLLGGFAQAQIETLTTAELDELEDLLDINDQDLFSWMTGRTPVPAERDRPLYRRILAFHADKPF